MYDYKLPILFILLNSQYLVGFFCLIYYLLIYCLICNLLDFHEESSILFSCEFSDSLPLLLLLLLSLLLFLLLFLKPVCFSFALKV